MVSSEPLRQTPLHGLHHALGARLVPFAGYEMPLNYPEGIVREHLHTRAGASLFDVSHMGQLRLTGRLDALEALCPLDVAALAQGHQIYTLFTNEAGGILDDLMVLRSGDHLVLVVNAARKVQDLAHLRQHLAPGCHVDSLEQRALLALQGPAAARALAAIAPGVSALAFMRGAWFDVAGAECLVTRSGYTGEDGFEISVPAEAAEATARALLAQPHVAPAGLGARDSLRLEAGLCLHGQDIDVTTTPVEAGLAWTIAHRRRHGPDAGFPGAEPILRQLTDGPAHRRVGLLPAGPAPVRAGAVVHGPGGTPIGRITSGGFSPSLKRPIAMGYVAREHAAAGSRLHTVLRGREVALEVVALPFVPHRYHRV